MTREEFFNGLAGGSRWDVGVSINRSNSLPLDAYSIFDSYQAAALYASKNDAAIAKYNEDNKDNENVVKLLNNAYVGQIITVWEKVETLNADNETILVDDVKVYCIDADLSLKPVGIVPTGDAASIEVDSTGSVTLYGFATADANTLPRKKITYKTDEQGNATEEVESEGIEWVSVSDIFAAPEYAIKKLETPSEGSQATYKLTKDGTEVDVAIEIPEFPTITHPVYTVVKETRAEGATETRYHLEKDGVEIAEDIVVPDAYDDTALAGRVAAVENFFKTADGEELNEALDTLIEIQNYINSDGEVSAQVLANKQAIEVLNGNEDTDGSVAKAIKVASSNLSSQITVVDTKASNAQKAIDDYTNAHATDYTNSQIDNAISSAIIAENLGQYAIASDVQSALNGKQDTITTTEIEHTSDNKTEGVTLTNGKLAIVIDAYTKAETYTKNEVNTAISNKISEMTGGESAADVLSALNDYKKATDAEIYGAQFIVDHTTTSNEKEIYAPDYTKDSRIDIVTRVASTNSSNIVINSSNIAVLSTNIASVSSNLDALSDKVVGEGGLTARVAVLEQFDKDHKQNYTDLLEVVGTKANSENVYTKAESSNLVANAIDALNITQYAKSADVYTKTAADTAASNIASSAIEALDLANTYITKTDSSNNIAAAISTLSTNIANTYITSTQSSNDIAAAIDALSSEINIGAYITSSAANATFAKIGDAYTKTEADAAFMTEAEVDARINTLIVAADPEGGKVISDIQNLVKYVDENAGQITGLISTVSTNSSNISALQVLASSNSSYISDLIVTVSTNSSEIDELQNIASSNSSNIAVIETAISSTIPAAIVTAKTEAKSEVLAEVSANYVTANDNDELTIGGKVIVLYGGNAGVSTQNSEAAE